MLLDCQEDVQVVSSREALARLSSEWLDLWNLDPAATPFQTAIWLTQWQRHFHGEPHVVLCRSNDRLIGVLPLNIVETPQGRRVQFLGEGISDHLDGLYLPGYEEEIARAFWRYLIMNGGYLGDCVLNDLRTSSPLYRFAPEQCVRQAAEPAPALALTGATCLRDFLPATQFQKLSYYLRRSAKLGLTIESAAPDNFEELLSSLFRLHTQRWRSRDLAGALSDPRVRQFHAEVGWEFLEHGLLRLYALRFRKAIIATFYGFTSTDTTFYYLGGFDPAFARLSPGLLLIAHAIEEAIGEKHACFDFLRGTEPYKYKWGAKDKPKCSLAVRLTNL